MVCQEVLKSKDGIVYKLEKLKLNTEKPKLTKTNRYIPYRAITESAT